MPKIVIKADGTQEHYQKEKVVQSLKRIGTSDEIINEILEIIDKEFLDKITTKKLYQRVFEILREKKRPLSTKYNLKKAIFLLGPSGYPFEQFFSQILNSYGYQTQTNLYLSGKCLTYEIDILAKKNSVDYLIECKYHHSFYKKNDLKVVLYVYGRFIDLKVNFPKSNVWIATNTKFTLEAIKFAECYNLKLTSWDYPVNESLPYLIEEKKLYPVTILTSANRKVFKDLIKNGIILIQDLIKREKRFLLKITNLKEKELDEILFEARELTEEY